MVATSAPARDAAAPAAPADLAQPPADAVKLPSGVVTRVVTPGTGAQHPTATDYVEVLYSGWRRNGVLFEGTGDEPVRLDRADIIPGLDQGIGLMVEGEKRRLWIPFALAYGARPNHVNAPQEDMTFDVQLLRIVSIPPAPTDAARPPRDARKTRSGLVYRYLNRGTGTRHPGKDSWVQVDQTMWTPDGRLVHTSRRSTRVARIPVSELIPGWREAMLLMVEGDRLRLWMPGKLAFGEPIPGQDPLPFAPPPGPLVMDVELLKIAD